MEPSKILAIENEIVARNTEQSISVWTFQIKFKVQRNPLFVPFFCSVALLPAKTKCTPD